MRCTALVQAFLMSFVQEVWLQEGTVTTQITNQWNEPGDVKGPEYERSSPVLLCMTHLLEEYAVI